MWLWNVADRTRPALIDKLAGHVDHVNAVAFSPNGRLLVSASDDHSIRLWDVTDPTHPTSLGSPVSRRGDAVTSLAFNADDRLLAVAGADHTIQLWDITDPLQPVPYGTPLTAHTDGIRSVAFSSNGAVLASGGDDHTVLLWPMDIGNAFRRICAASAGALAVAELRQQLSDLSLRPPCPQ